MPLQAQHILIIHIAGLAQTTLALPALRSLRAHLPESRITVATSAIAADLIRLAGCADEVLAVGRLRHAELFKPTALFRSAKAIGELRHSNFDLAIEFKTNTEGSACQFGRHKQNQRNRETYAQPRDNEGQRSRDDDKSEVSPPARAETGRRPGRRSRPGG